MMSEIYHNDHHQHPSDANFGVRWFEIDPVYYIILLFDKLHIVRLNTNRHVAKPAEVMLSAAPLQLNKRAVV